MHDDNITVKLCVFSKKDLFLLCVFEIKKITSTKKQQKYNILSLKRKMFCNKITAKIYFKN